MSETKTAPRPGDTSRADAIERRTVSLSITEHQRCVLVTTYELDVTPEERAALAEMDLDEIYQWIGLHGDRITSTDVAQGESSMPHAYKFVAVEAVEPEDDEE